MIEPVKHLLTGRQIYAPPNEVLRNYAKPYYEPEISNGGVDWAEALNMVEHGASAVLQLVPFLCLGSIISAAMGSQVRHEVGGVPWLDVALTPEGDEYPHAPGGLYAPGGAVPAQRRPRASAVHPPGERDTAQARVTRRVRP